MARSRFRSGKWGWLVLAGLLALPAAAAERRVESVGVAAVEAEGSGATAPRDRALVNAVERAVLRTAQLQLPPDFEPPAPPPGADAPEAGTTRAWLSDALGADLLAYARQFSILEDRGQRPAMFSERPEVGLEYVVLAEVRVDVGALRDQLAARGVLQRAGGELRHLELVIEGLESYRPLALLRQALEEHGAVRSVVPVEFSPGRAVLSVASDLEAAELVSDLEAGAPAGLQLVAVELGPREATLLLDWDGPDLVDTPGLNR